MTPMKQYYETLAATIIKKSGKAPDGRLLF